MEGSIAVLQAVEFLVPSTPPSYACSMSDSQDHDKLARQVALLEERMNTMEAECRSRSVREQWCMKDIKRLADGDLHLKEKFWGRKEFWGSVIRVIVRSLSSGTVVTYGDISCRVYGHAKGGPAVAEAIKKAQDPEFPWWRVVNDARHPTQEMEGTRERLEEEGIEFRKDGSVKRRFHDPDQIGALTTLDVAVLGVLFSETGSLRGEVQAATEALARIAAILDEWRRRGE